MDSNVTAVSDVLTTASNTIALSSFILTWGLGLLTIVGVVLTIALQYYLAQDKKRQIKDAIDNILKKFASDENLKNEMISHILMDKDFQAKFDALIDSSIDDKLDDKIKDRIGNTIKETFMKGLNDE